MYRHICKSCGKSVEVAVKKAVCRCSCRTIMTNLGIVEHDFKAQRIRSSLSQSALAKLLGVTKSYISMVENGKVSVPLELEERLNKVFLEASERAR